MEGILLTLAVLACPAAMGVMMWFMGKGMRGQQSAQAESDGAQPSLDDLRTEQRRLADEIGRLEEREGERAVDGQLANR